MKRTTTAKLFASLLVLGLLVFGIAGCNGEDTPESTTPEESVPEEESLPFTEPETDTGAPGRGMGGNGFGEMHDNAIIMQDNRFVPAMLEVTVGEKVTFFNGDTTDHDVRVGSEDLGRVSHGEVLEWTAEAAGTYPVVCTIHPNMTGEIVVR